MILAIGLMIPINISRTVIMNWRNKPNVPWNTVVKVSTIKESKVLPGDAVLTAIAFNVPLYDETLQVNIPVNAVPFELHNNVSEVLPIW